jgi:hypothetical protein
VVTKEDHYSANLQLMSKFPNNNVSDTIWMSITMYSK